MLPFLIKLVKNCAVRQYTLRSVIAQTPAFQGCFSLTSEFELPCFIVKGVPSFVNTRSHSGIDVRMLPPFSCTITPEDYWSYCYGWFVNFCQSVELRYSRSIGCLTFAIFSSFHDYVFRCFSRCRSVLNQALDLAVRFFQHWFNERFVVMFVVDLYLTFSYFVSFVRVYCSDSLVRLMSMPRVSVLL